METKTRVAVYCRHSSDEELEPLRREWIRMIDENPQWTLSSIYSDEKGSDQRTALKHLMEDAESEKFDLILIKTMSQLSRNVTECVKVIQGLRSLPKPVGVQILDIGMNSLSEDFEKTVAVLAMAEQEEERMGDIDASWSAACGNDKATIREYYERGGERNVRYRAFGRENSLVMGAYRNGFMDMCELLISYGETVTDEEKEELLEPERRRKLISMLGIA